MRNVKNDLVLKQIAGLIFIYLFIWGNNAHLILEVIDHREKRAAKGSRECVLTRAKTPLLLLTTSVSRYLNLTKSN